MASGMKSVSRIISVVMAMALSLAVAGCGSGGAGRVVNAFFDSIDKHDTEMFLNCFQEDVADEILSYSDEDELEDQLEMLDELLVDEYGKNWRKKIKVGKAEEVEKEDDIIHYDVEYTFDDEEDYIPVIKVKGRFYIDKSGLGSIF
jgi:hypothetical protein